ncbi:MAG: capsule assembly Wzi family protein [Muribaculaceae bacterium]
MKINNAKYVILKYTIAICVISFCGIFSVKAEYPINYNASIIANAGSGDFAPYYMASNVHGILTQPFSTLIRAGVNRNMSKASRFSYGFGADIIGGYTSRTLYSYYNVDNNALNTHSTGPSTIWIQQLYGEVKYRGVFLTLGLKEQNSTLLNQQLSSGDMTSSGNSRPMPGVRAGFIDFQNVPFTNGWVQIKGELAFAKPTDSSWLENHYNYLNYFITTKSWHNYKQIYFRTKPTERFSATIGMQAAAQFGGTYRQYINGEMTSETKIDLGIKDFFKALIPMSGSSGNLKGDYVYYAGNHIGSWDFVGEYRLRNNDVIKGYVQFPWEDGSGIGKLNGFDGLYGIEYRSAKPQIVSGAVIEYIDLTNQSGPLHWAPADRESTPIVNPATGADDYYNNYMYNGYQYYGMSIGSPFVKSPLYNRDGYMRYTDNRIRGFHAGISGNIIAPLQYRMLVSYRSSLGTPIIPAIEKRHNTSFMLEGLYTLPKLPELCFKGQIAFDKGTLYGDNFGVLLSITYRGLIKL